MQNKYHQPWKKKLNKTKLISLFLKNVYSYSRNRNSYLLKMHLIVQPVTSCSKLSNANKFIIPLNSWSYSLRGLQQIQEASVSKIIQKFSMINIYRWKNYAMELFPFYKILIWTIFKTKINNNISNKL